MCQKSTDTRQYHTVVLCNELCYVAYQFFHEANLIKKYRDAKGINDKTYSCSGNFFFVLPKILTMC